MLYIIVTTIIYCDKGIKYVTYYSHSHTSIYYIKNIENFRTIILYNMFITY